MSRPRIAIAARIALCTVAAAVTSLPFDAAASAQRTFVSGAGTDVNACSLGAPCRTFAAAIAQTNPGGELIVLDSAGYGPVTITKSVSIIAPPGIYAGISVFSGDGITINGALIDVRLHGLSINAQGGDNGINFTAGASLFVDRCTIGGFAAAGIVVNGVGNLTIVDTALVRNDIGIWTKAAATLLVSRATIDQSADDGIFLTAGANASVFESTIAHTSFGTGVQALGSAAGTTRVAIESSLISDNHDRGFLVFATVDPARADIVRSTVTRNGGSGVEVEGNANVQVGAMQNLISDNGGSGVFSSGGAKTRASANTILRNHRGMVGNALLYSPGNNYSRDNTLDDATSVTADPLF